MPRLVGMLIMLSVLTGSVLLAQEPKKEPELSKEVRAKLEAEVKRIDDEGVKLYQAAKLSEAEKAFCLTLQLRRRLYPPARYPDGHPDLAISLNNLGVLLQAQGRLADAEPLLYEALVLYKKRYPPNRYPQGHLDLARGMTNLAALLKAQGQLTQAEPLCRDALAMRQKLHPPDRFPLGHPQIATSLHNLANLLQVQGQLTQAEPLYRDALAMQYQLYPPTHYPQGHPDLARSLTNLASLLQDQGQLTKAEPLCRRALAMRQKLYPPTHYPQGHPDLTQSLNNLAALLQAQGQYTQAEPLYCDALAMRQKLYSPAHYPQGHPHLATSLDNLANLLQAQSQLTQAEPLYRSALAMRQKLYPPDRFPHGHPDLAQSLSNLAYLFYDQDKLTLAEPLCRDALLMYQKLYPPNRYPQGHSDLAQSLNNLAVMLQAQGQYTQAKSLCRDALAMRQKLYPPTHYPQGHPNLAQSLNNLAAVLQAQGQFSLAEPLYRDALTMYHHLALAYADVRGEGEVLTLLAAQPGTQHAYLSLVQQQPSFTSQAYATLWTNRNLLMRLAAQKNVAVRAAVISPALRQRWTELVNLKRQRAQLLMASESRDSETVKARERQREEWDRQIHDLSARVCEGLPVLQELQRQDTSSPADLQKTLTKEAIFVELMRYTFLGNDAANPEKKGEKRPQYYVAFITTKEQSRRVDLGPAEPLQEAVRRWRVNLTGNNPASTTAPATLRRLLWEPLEKHFPPGITTVYLCPDQQLCFLPWGALPGKKNDTVLLEEYTLAIVPHGPYLLGQLLGTKEKQEKQTDVLVLGGVKYDDAPVQATMAMAERGQDDPKAAPVLASKGGWRYLPGTSQEAEAIRKLAEQRQSKTHYLSGTEAGVEQMRQELPKARIAHLATHGFFADPKFRSVFQLDEKLFAMRGQERVGAGALLPSLLSGLVFAGANRPETPGRGIVTAEELFDLDLTGMELAVLSACETGLGDVGGGEGVFGLQRAFHVAGCQNVIASLWKVNDVATMVLMEEFYRNLWEKKLSKREALRQAQLTVYRNPDLVLKRRDQLRAELMKAGATKEQLAQRGIEDEAAPLPAAGPGALRRSPPTWWAAFLLSGLGD